MRASHLERLGQDFFARDTLRVARELLGAFIVRKIGGETLIARIVETEAYRGEEPACHAYANLQRVQLGKPPRGRSALLFGEPGTAYVYLNHGMYWLFNVVTESAGTAGAVLFRAIEPVSGIERMRLSRPSAKSDEKLGNGPGKLTLALDIGAKFNGHALHDSRELYLARGPGRSARRKIATSPRIGITRARTLPWRFYLDEHACVSKP